MKIGLVTVLYNSDEMLPDFFESLFIQCYKNFILILVDNSPSKKTNDILIKLSNETKIQFIHLQMQNNIGVAAANNVGIKQALSENCDTILLLNNDIVFNQINCFSRLVDLAKSKKIIVPKILYYNTNKVWYGGGLFRNWFGFVKHTGCGLSESSITINKAKNTFYAPTCFALIDKIIFENIGLMDEQYFVYSDDTDFMYRAYKAGYRVWYEPSLVIEHKISQSTGGMTSNFSLYYDTRNKIYYSRKFNNFLLKISSMFFGIFLAVLFAVKTRRKSAFVSVFKAVVDGYKMKVIK